MKAQTLVPLAAAAAAQLLVVGNIAAAFAFQQKPPVETLVTVPVVAEIEQVECVRQDPVPYEPVTYQVPLDAELQSYTEKMCDLYDVPLELAYAVMQVESGFTPAARSSTGDYGLMQIPAIRSKGYGPQGHSFGASRRGMESGFAVIWCASISAIIGQNRNFMAVESGGRTERPSSSGNEVGAKKLSISCASAQSCPRCCWPPLARISRTHWRPTPTNLRMMFGKC